MAITLWKVGERVQAHPATDVWMRGARFGTVRKVGRKWVHVKLDKLDRIVKFSPDLLMPEQGW